MRCHGRPTPTRTRLEVRDIVRWPPNTLLGSATITHGVGVLAHDEWPWVITFDSV